MSQKHTVVGVTATDKSSFTCKIMLNSVGMFRRIKVFIFVFTYI